MLGGLIGKLAHTGPFDQGEARGNNVLQFICRNRVRQRFLQQRFGIGITAPHASRGKHLLRWQAGEQAVLFQRYDPFGNCDGIIETALIEPELRKTT